jgi:glycerophosphoryl diester phosphodiesterase
MHPPSLPRLAAAASAAFFVALALAGSAPHASAAATPGCPMVVDHAAGAGMAPENTAVGIAAGAATGAPMVEMDVRWSANNNTQANPGYPVLMHDPTLDRTTSGTGNVADSGLTAMTKMSAADYAPWNTDARFKGFKADGSPVTPVPYAWDFVHASSAAGVDMLLDVKVTPGQWGAAKLMQYVDQFGYRTHLIYMGTPDNVIAMHGWYPDLRYAVIEYPPTGRIYTPEYLKSIGASTYVIPWDSVTPGLVGYFHAAGVQVFTWTSDRPTYDIPANWAALATDGVDAIITDQPAAVLAQLAPACTPHSTAPTSEPISTPPTTEPSS